jgi:hypothetical protein
LTVALALSFVMPATSVFAAAEPIDTQRLARGVLAFFVPLIGDGGSLLDIVTPDPPIEEPPAIDWGNDGRLTMLLLGMDSREDTVTRTDTVMVMSLKDGQISAASIPRDTKRMPNPFGAGVFGKVNSVLRDLYVAENNDLDAALDDFEVVIEETMRIEIDYHALVWFDGFTTLVDEVDGGSSGITVNIRTTISDARHHDLPGDSFGVYFPQAIDYRLYALNPASQSGSPRCDGRFKRFANPDNHPGTWCRRALPFVRTRHGSSDYIRGRHQQQFIDATIDAVDASELSGLVATAVMTGKGKWWTNFPITLEAATELYDALQGAGLTASAVFKPSGYAAQIPGQNGIELDLRAVRAWCDEYMS